MYSSYINGFVYIHAFLFLFFVYFRWMQTGSLQASSHVSSLSWNLEGTRLLTGGLKIQMWHEKITNKEEEPNGMILHFKLSVNLQRVHVQP